MLKAYFFRIKKGTLLRLQMPLLFAMLCLLSTVQLAAQQFKMPDFSRKKFEGKISMAIPETFKQLTDDEMADRSLSSRKPIAMFMDMSQKSELVISTGNNSKNPWNDKDLELLQSFSKSNIQALYTKTTFLTDEIQKIGKQKFAVFEFVSELKEKNKPAVKKYTYIMYTIRKKQVYVFNFSCPEADKNIMDAIAEKAMKSVKFE